MRTVDIAIIGGGAAGMTAAITAAVRAPEKRILIIEKNDRLGRKLRATGNGRCNLTNTACPGYEETIAFFREIGVQTRVEQEGRVYPLSGDAADVVEALTARVKRLGIEVICGTACEKVTKTEEGFALDFVKSRKLLIAAGGKAAPAFGTTGDGTRIAKSLGLSVTRLAPALTGVETKEDLKSLAGVRTEAEVTLLREGREVFREPGEVQFAEYGISGICVMNLSRHLTIAPGKSLADGFDDYEIQIDLLPGRTPAEAEALIEQQKQAGLEGADLFRSIVKAPIAARLWQEACGQSGRLAESLQNFRLHPKGLRGWKQAQVTKGGVEYTEVDTSTMEAVSCPGLYLAGEVMDYDGPCGGWNLQHAWESGMTAGRGMTR